MVRSCVRCGQVCMRDRELTFPSHSVFTALTSDTSVTGEGRLVSQPLHQVPGPHTMSEDRSWPISLSRRRVCPE